MHKEYQSITFRASLCAELLEAPPRHPPSWTASGVESGWRAIPSPWSCKAAWTSTRTKMTTLRGYMSLVTAAGGEGIRPVAGKPRTPC